MGLRQFLMVLGERWRSLVGVILLGLVTTGVLIWLTPAVYQSSATLFVSTPPTKGLVNTYAAAIATQERVQSYAQLASDEAVLEATVVRLDGRLSFEELEDQVSSHIIEGTLLVVIDAEAESPELAREVATIVADEVLDMITGLESMDDEDAELPFIATLASEPSPEDNLIQPDLPIAIGTGVLLSILVGLCVAVMREVLDTTISSAAHLKAATGHSLVTVVPRDRDASDDLAVGGPAAEAFRVLRTNLQFADLDTPQPLVVVTSPAPGEGKTFVACGLAIAQADAGRSVLLIDADLRRPGVADRLGLDGVVGLVTVLVGKTTFEDATVDHASGVTVLPAGPLPPNPSALLESQAMRDLLDHVRGRYDIVLIDAPSVLPTADASILVSQTDGAVLVAREGVTRREEARMAVERIAAVSGRLFSTVLNGSSSVPAAYGYEPLRQQAGGSGRRKASRAGGRRAQR